GRSRIPRRRPGFRRRGGWRASRRGSGASPSLRAHVKEDAHEAERADDTDVEDQRRRRLARLGAEPLDLGDDLLVASPVVPERADEADREGGEPEEHRADVEERDHRRRAVTGVELDEVSARVGGEVYLIDEGDREDDREDPERGVDPTAAAPARRILGAERGAEAPGALGGWLAAATAGGEVGRAEEVPDQARRRQREDQRALGVLGDRARGERVRHQERRREGEEEPQRRAALDADRQHRERERRDDEKGAPLGGRAGE